MGRKGSGRESSYEQSFGVRNTGASRVFRRSAHGAKLPDHGATGALFCNSVCATPIRGRVAISADRPQHRMGSARRQRVSVSTTVNACMGSPDFPGSNQERQAAPLALRADCLSFTRITTGPCNWVGSMWKKNGYLCVELDLQPNMDVLDFTSHGPTRLRVEPLRKLSSICQEGPSPHSKLLSRHLEKTKIQEN